MILLRIEVFVNVYFTWTSREFFKTDFVANWKYSWDSCNLHISLQSISFGHLSPPKRQREITEIFTWITRQFLNFCTGYLGPERSSPKSKSIQGLLPPVPSKKKSHLNQKFPPSAPIFSILSLFHNLTDSNCTMGGWLELDGLLVLLLLLCGVSLVCPTTTTSTNDHRCQWYLFGICAMGYYVSVFQLREKTNI